MILSEIIFGLLLGIDEILIAYYIANKIIFKQTEQVNNNV